MLYSRPGTGTKLNFVEYNQRTGFLVLNLTRNKPPFEVQFKVHEKHVEVVHVVVEKLLYLGAYLTEIHQDVRLIFVTRKLLCHIAFTYTPCAFYQ